MASSGPSLSSLAGSGSGAGAGPAAFDLSSDFVGKYQTTRVRGMLRANYKRIFGLKKDSFITIDPGNFRETHEHPYSLVTAVTASSKDPTEFTMEVKKEGKMKYQCEFRSRLLSEFVRLRAESTGAAGQQFPAQRRRRSGELAGCMLSVFPQALQERTLAGDLVSSYDFVNMQSVGVVSDVLGGFYVSYGGRGRMFVCAQRDAVIGAVSSAASKIGITIPGAPPLTQEAFARLRAEFACDAGQPLVTYNVDKRTARHATPVARKLVVTEQFLVEKDAATYSVVSARPLTSIFALVRSWDNPRQLIVEYCDGSSRAYLSGDRDTALGSLLDAARMQQNTRVIVTAEVSDGMRLLPRFAVEDADRKLSLKESFFGADTIERWFLKKLARVAGSQCSKHGDRQVVVQGGGDLASVVMAAAELNANVPISGITPSSDKGMVKNALVPLMAVLDYLSRVQDGDEPPHPSLTATLLQSAVRIIPASHAFRMFLEIPLVIDTLLRLLHSRHEFICYWAVRVLCAVVNHSIQARNKEQEYVNKQVLLRSGELCNVLVSLLRKGGVRGFGQDGEAEQAGSALVVMAVATLLESVLVSRQDTTSPDRFTELLCRVGREELALMAMLRSPCSVIMENGALLMQVATEEMPELANRIRDMALYEAVLLRHLYGAIFSPSADQRFISRHLVGLWMTGDARAPQKRLLNRMLPHGLLQFFDLPMISEQEAAALDDLEASEDGPYAGITSAKPSRISSNILRLKNRINIAHVRSVKRRETRASGGFEERKSSTGRVSFSGGDERKVGASSFAERPPSNVVGQGPAAAAVAAAAAAPAAPLPQGAALPGDRDRAVSVPIPAGPPALQSHSSVPGTQQSGAPLAAKAADMPRKDPPPVERPRVFSAADLPFENWRVFFHMIMQDHLLPDLIWNQETRRELRHSLEQELAGFEREQQQLGYGRVAWNYQEFRISYPSLANEVKVGDHYLRLFLEASDVDCMGGVKDPARFMDALYRRLLRERDRDPALSSLCLRCLTRVYNVASATVGTFDDSDFVGSMLGSTGDKEMRDRLLEFWLALMADPRNAEQLLNREAVELLADILAFSHTNARQIGNKLARETAHLLLQNSAGGTQNFSEAYASSAHESKGESADADAADDAYDDSASPPIWYCAPSNPRPPRQGAERGPFRISELKAMLAEGAEVRIKPNCLVTTVAVEDYTDDDDAQQSNIDTGRWKEIGEVRQLQWQALSSGTAVFTPAESGTMALQLLMRVVEVHSSHDHRGVPVRPVPMAQKLLSSPRCLPVLSQCLLANDPAMVDSAARLLGDIMQHDTVAQRKLYLNGTFMFGCLYTGNNFGSIARLFALTHTKQHFRHDASAVASRLPMRLLSVLGEMLPESILNVMENYGHTKFAETFVGDYDTPEVIWTYDMRKHLIEMLSQHLGDFPLRITQNMHEKYTYCPMPGVVYENLENEVYCHNYYLRNLCDEVRFPDWPIAEPVDVLRSVLEEWGAEATKVGDGGDISTEDARKVLGVGAEIDAKGLRRAYRNLARKYHPDKNPQGRDMFEKIQEAYEVLCSKGLTGDDGKSEGPDLDKIFLMLKTQVILCRRYGGDLKEYKYPAYAMLLDILQLHGAHSKSVEMSDQRLNLIMVAAELSYWTCFVSPRNGEELIRQGGVDVLHEIINFFIPLVGPDTPADDINMKIVVHAMHTMSGLAHFEIGREAMVLRGAKLPEDIYVALSFTGVPHALQYSLECTHRMAASATLQGLLVAAGVVWRIIPLLLNYDATIEGVNVEDGQLGLATQLASNLNACLSSTALGRLGGYMFENFASPKNDTVRAAMSTLLTPPLAKLLRNKRAQDLLRSLNENCESASKIWNISMREELLEFVSNVLKERPVGSDENDLDRAAGFEFTALRNELALGGVYIRLFNAMPDLNEVDDSHALCEALLEFIHAFLSSQSTNGQPAAPSSARRSSSVTSPDTEHLKMAVQALKNLVLMEPSTLEVILELGAVPILFSLMERDASNETVLVATDIVAELAPKREFAARLAEDGQVWRLMRLLRLQDDDAISRASWGILQGLCATSEIVSLLLRTGGVIECIGMLCGCKGSREEATTEKKAVGRVGRVGAAQVLARLLQDPAMGARAMVMVAKFFPEPMCIVLRGNADEAVTLLDGETENPELVWNAEMRGELRAVVEEQLEAYLRQEPGSDYTPIAQSVEYAALQSEVYIGGVYLRLFLKEPTFNLRDPQTFLERVATTWIAECEKHAPLPNQSGAKAGPGAEQQTSVRTLVLGKMDMITLLTSALVFILKVRGMMADQLISWGYIPQIITLLQRTNDSGAVGTPQTSCIRVIHQISERTACVEAVIASPLSVAQQLLRTLEPTLSKDAGFIIEALKKLCQSPAHNHAMLVSSVMELGVVAFLLDNVLEAPHERISHLVDASAAKVHSIELLKLLAADADVGARATALLEAHPAWNKYKHQRHDLYITSEQKMDYFLTGGEDNDPNQKLLTYGSAGAGPSSSTIRRTEPPAAQQKPVPSLTPASAQAPAPAPAPAPAGAVAVPVSATAAPPVDEGGAGALPIPPGVNKVTVVLNKGAEGLGIDIAEQNGRAIVKRLKDIPNNPATTASPPIQVNDVIYAVNRQVPNSFRESIGLLRDCSGTTVLVMLR